MRLPLSTIYLVFYSLVFLSIGSQSSPLKTVAVEHDITKTLAPRAFFLREALMNTDRIPISSVDDNVIDVRNGTFDRSFSIGSFNSQKHAVIGVATSKGAMIIRITNKRLQQCYPKRRFQYESCAKAFDLVLFNNKNGIIYQVVEHWKKTPFSSKETLWPPDAFEMVVTNARNSHQKNHKASEMPLNKEALDYVTTALKRFLKTSDGKQIPSILQGERVKESFLDPHKSLNKETVPRDGKLLPAMVIEWDKKSLTYQFWVGSLNQHQPYKRDALSNFEVGYYPPGTIPWKTNPSDPPTAAAYPSWYGTTKQSL